MFIYKKLNNYSKTKRLIFMSIISTIILTILEYITGNLIELVFHTSFWNYSNFKFNIGKYIKKIPNTITYIISFIFIIDLVLSIIRIFSLK